MAAVIGVGACSPAHGVARWTDQLPLLIENEVSRAEKLPCLTRPSPVGGLRLVLLLTCKPRITFPEVRVGDVRVHPTVELLEGLIHALKDLFDMLCLMSVTERLGIHHDLVFRIDGGNAVVALDDAVRARHLRTLVVGYVASSPACPGYQSGPRYL